MVSLGDAVCFLDSSNEPDCSMSLMRHSGPVSSWYGDNVELKKLSTSQRQLVSVPPDLSGRVAICILET